MAQVSTLDPLSALATAVSEKNREELLLQNPQLATPATVEALYDRVSHFLRVDLSQADLAARSSLWLAHHLNHQQSIALSLRGLGNVHLFQGKPDKAIQNFKRALKLFSAQTDDSQVAHTYLNLCAAYLNLGDYTTAHQIASTARELLQELNDTLGLARLENNLGSLLFRQEKYADARQHWQSALAAFRQLDRSHDAAIALRNLAVCEISLNNFREALAIYNEVSIYCQEHGLTLLLHEIDYNIAYLYFLRGDHDRALEGYRLARQRSLALGDSYHAALCDLDESELYLELNLLPDAAALAKSAATQFRTLGKTYEMAKALALQAIASARLGEDHQALDLLRSAHEAFSSQGHLAWASLAQLYEAFVLFREGRLFEARRSTLAALHGFEEVPSPAKSSLCHLLLAQLHLESQDDQAAHLAVSEALTLIDNLDVPHIRFQALLLQGQVQESIDHLPEARSAYYRAAELLKSLRTQLSVGDLHIPFPHSRLAVYDHLITLESILAPKAEFPEIAFSLIEQAKARTVSDLLGSRAASIGPSQPARSSLVEKVRGLREELRWYYKKMSQREMLAQPLGALKPGPSLQEMERKLLASLSELSTSDREYGHLHQALTIDLRQAQDLLGEDEVLLEYFAGDGVVTSVVLSRSTASCQSVAVSSEISELHRILDFQSSRVLSSDLNSGRRDRSTEFARQCLRRLYQELVGPVMKEMRDFSRVKVIPHGFLAYLPFHAFVIDDGTDCELGELFAFSYAPSVASLFLGRTRSRSLSRGAALVLAGHGEQQPRNHPLLSAPWSGEWIRSPCPREVWQSSLRAPRSLVFLPLNTTYRSDNPALSGIEIAGCQMTLLDLFQVELNAEVVVVSGCGPTSVGLGTGDELLCLSRSLLYSGPDCVVLPLRKGRSDARRVVLEHFYAELAAGQPPDRALQAAQAACKGSFPHVAEWAPLAVYGS